jgi:hypothetical protein
MCKPFQREISFEYISIYFLCYINIVLTYLSPSLKKYIMFYTLSLLEMYMEAQKF